MASYYEYIRKYDILFKLDPHLKRGTLRIRTDGQIEPSSTSYGYDSPWIFARTVTSKYCELWHQIMFKIFDLLPSPCLNCYKVVCRPRDLVELMQLENLQKRLDLPSKCGIETRETVNGLYGGYFYSDSLEKGKELYKKVREEIDTHISPDLPVILKRGCTEFELKFGRSDEWDDKISEQQREFETVLKGLIVFPRTNPTLRPDHVIDHKHSRWIHWAYEHGDNSYLGLTDGVRLYPHSVTYHEEKKDGKKKIKSQTKPTGSKAEVGNNTKAGIWGKLGRTKSETKGKAG